VCCLAGLTLLLRSGRLQASVAARWQQSRSFDMQNARAIRKSAESAVMAMHARGWTLATIDSLPPATALPLQAALLKCRQAPPPGMQPDALRGAFRVGSCDTVCWNQLAKARR